MKIIAFVGMPASGKSEAATITKEMGYPVVNMGDVIREEVHRLGLELTDENLGGTGTKLRQKEGPAAIARRCLPKLRSYDADTIVIDGVRNIEEVDLFKKEFGDVFLLINIESSTRNRLARIRARDRADDRSMHEEGLNIRDQRELGWGMEESIKSADLSINNNGTIEEFRENIRKIIEEYR
jgi:dephospho-CoA kinase